MSSKKRRRITKKTKEMSKIDIFRENLVVKISGYDYRISVYGNSSRHQDKEKKWGSMKEDDRVKEILRSQEWHLGSMLKRWKVSDLKSFYVENFPIELQKSNISKTILISEINNRFFGRKGDLERRDEEVENISLLSEDFEERQTLSFLTLHGLLIPKDLLIFIISFLKYDNALLFRLGCVSKVFYISILTSWPHIVLDKNNIFIVSVLVLKNVRSVTFSGVPLKVKSYGRTSKPFLNSEIEQGVKYFSSNRLRSLEYHGRFSEFFKFLRCISRLKNRDGFKNVRRLKFKICRFSGQNRKELEAICKKWPVLLKDLFPNLNHVSGINNFESVKGLSIEKLSVDENYHRLSFSHSNNAVSSIYEKIGKLGTKKRDKFLQKEYVKELKVWYCKFVPNFLKGFANLEMLKIGGPYVGSEKRNTTVVPLSSVLSKCSFGSTLKKLILRNSLSEDHWKFSQKGEIGGLADSYWGFILYHNDGISSILPCLETLIVESRAGSSILDCCYFLSSKNLKNLKTSLVLNYPNRSSQERTFERLLLNNIVSQRFFDFETVSMDIRIQTRTKSKGHDNPYLQRIRSLLKKSRKYGMSEMAGSEFDECCINVNIKYNRKLNYYRPKRSSFTIDLFSESNCISNGIDLSKLTFLSSLLDEIPQTLAFKGINTRFVDFLSHSFFRENDSTCPFFSNVVDPQQRTGISFTNCCCCISVFDRRMKEEGYKIVKKVTESEKRRIKFSIVLEETRKISYIYSRKAKKEKLEKRMKKENEMFVYQI